MTCLEELYNLSQNEGFSPEEGNIFLKNIGIVLNFEHFSYEFLQSNVHNSDFVKCQ